MKLSDSVEIIAEVMQFNIAFVKPLNLNWSRETAILIISVRCGHPLIVE